ncbi:RtcB family protein [Gottschalkia acidurici]|uniref:RtcB family protein n=1 Tax=Clostridium acidurici TaxID=1556 RepID=UPI0005A0D525
MIPRKGSTSVKDGERALIPINTQDCSIICIGKRNEDWNGSTPRGAGRLMSRSKVKQSINFDTIYGIHGGDLFYHDQSGNHR